MGGAMIEIHNEDCLATLAGMAPGSVDLLLQDTPFGCTQNEWDIKPDLAAMWPEWERVTKEDGAMVFFATQPFASELIQSRAKNFRYDLIWHKVGVTGFLNAGAMPLRNHEHILVFYRKLPIYNPQMSVGAMQTKGRGGLGRSSSNYGGYRTGADLAKTNNTYYPRSIISFSNTCRSTGHFNPTQKPLEVVRYLVRTYSNENDLVFDGYSGSGTTAAACLQEKRRFVGSELSKAYFDNSLKRLALLRAAPELF